MEKNTNGVSELGQGLNSEKVLSLKDVKGMVVRDLSVVSAFMACLSDPDVADVIAVHLHGKYMNAKHKEELEKQLDLKI